jgi:GNAT superfamily N-acetyltransferase
MPMSVRIEAAGPADAGVLLRLIRELARFEKLEDRVLADEALIRAELASSRPVIEGLMAWRGEEAVGYALYFHNFSTFLARRGLYLEDLYVTPALRGKGIGRALLARLASIARQRECGRFEWAVLDWNQGAIDFYRSLGAEVLPDWRICRVSGEALQQLAALAS